jgi:proline iminopeptidase
MGRRWIGCLGAVALGACETLTMAEPGNLVPATVVENPALPAITINGTRLHAETRGDPSKPVMIVLHGGPGADYRSMLPLAGAVGDFSLADRYFMVFWDQRGAGLSQRHDQEVLTLDQYDADLLALADRYSPGRPVTLLGHSWGGMYGTSFINRHPTRVAEAIFIETGPLTGATFERIKPDLYDLNIRREWLNDMAWATRFFSADDHARMDYQLLLGSEGAQPRNNSRRGPNGEPGWRYGAKVARYLMEDGQDASGTMTYDFTANLRQFTGRVLLIAGSRSEVLGPSLQREQLPRYANATLQIIESAGHDVQWTHTATVLGTIRDFLATSARGGAR